jgi:Holliday junction resolvase RusA-like endonuclease
VTTFSLRVNGIPVPQGNKTGFLAKGKDGAARLVVREGRDNEAAGRFRSWRQAVTDAAAQAPERPSEPLNGPVAVTLHFTFPRPASDRYRTRHTVKPDLDKLMRSVFDGLVAGGWLQDDSRVSYVVAGKDYGDQPGVSISVEDYTWCEAADRERLKEHARARR